MAIVRVIIYDENNNLQRISTPEDTFLIESIDASGSDDNNLLIGPLTASAIMMGRDGIKTFISGAFTASFASGTFFGDGSNLRGVTTDFNGLTGSITLVAGPNLTVNSSSLGDVSISGSTLSKSITVESPTSAEDLSIFFTNLAITVTEMRAVVRGSTPSVTWTIRHGTDRSAAGAQVVTGGTTTTSQTVGSDVTSFNDATIVADSFVWLETTAQTGTVDEMSITIIYAED